MATPAAAAAAAFLTAAALAGVDIRPHADTAGPMRRASDRPPAA